jgi:hypothetical protein
LTEKEKRAIRARFKETGDFHAVAGEFQIEPFRVGQLCREEKASMIAEREEHQRKNQTATTTRSEDNDIDMDMYGEIY